MNMPENAKARQALGRKSVRTTMSELKQPRRAKGGKQPPPADTNAESFYYLKQMNARTPMVVVLSDGEVIRGCIEWYDRDCLKINRDDGPNLLVQKRWIKYLHKAEG